MNIPRPVGRCANGHATLWLDDTDGHTVCPECQKDFAVFAAAFALLEACEASLDVLGGSEYDPEFTACCYLEQAITKAKEEKAR